MPKLSKKTHPRFRWPALLALLAAVVLCAWAWKTSSLVAVPPVAERNVEAKFPWLRAAEQSDSGAKPVPRVGTGPAAPDAASVTKTQLVASASMAHSLATVADLGAWFRVISTRPSEGGLFWANQVATLCVIARHTHPPAADSDGARRSLAARNRMLQRCSNLSDEEITAFRARTDMLSDPLQALFRRTATAGDRIAYQTQIAAWLTNPDPSLIGAPLNGIDYFMSIPSGNVYFDGNEYPGGTSVWSAALDAARMQAACELGYPCGGPSDMALEAVCIGLVHRCPKTREEFAETLWEMSQTDERNQQLGGTMSLSDFHALTRRFSTKFVEAVRAKRIDVFVPPKR